MIRRRPMMCAQAGSRGGQHVWRARECRYLHIIILACMIQVFKLICFGENKVENVQRRAVPTGGPAAGGEPSLVLLSFAS